jgi:hypothetical protein
MGAARFASFKSIATCGNALLDYLVLMVLKSQLVNCALNHTAAAVRFAAPRQPFA